MRELKEGNACSSVLRLLHLDNSLPLTHFQDGILPEAVATRAYRGLVNVRVGAVDARTTESGNGMPKSGERLASTRDMADAARERLGEAVSSSLGRTRETRLRPLLEVVGADVKDVGSRGGLAESSSSSLTASLLSSSITSFGAAGVRAAGVLAEASWIGWSVTGCGGSTRWPFDHSPVQEMPQ